MSPWQAGMGVARGILSVYGWPSHSKWGRSLKGLRASAKGAECPRGLRKGRLTLGSSRTLPAHQAPYLDHL